MNKTKKILYRTLMALISLVLVAMIFIGPIDRRPLKDQPFYQSMMEKIDTLHPEIYTSNNRLKTGWAKVNITPGRPTPMAGYKPRSEFKSIHDSLYTRCLFIDNGNVTIAIISIDLMLFPPNLRQQVVDSKPAGIDHIYFGATHTHNSIGGWDNSMAGQVIAGDYDPELVDQLTASVVASIQQAKLNLKASTLSYFHRDAKNYVDNRLDRINGKTDGIIRGIKINREDKSEGVFVTYSAHPTNISSTSKILSGDYPAMLVKTLNNRPLIEFSMFMAGMVGSHRLSGIGGKDFEKIASAGKILAQQVDSSTFKSGIDSLKIKFLCFPVEHGPAQLRISKNLKIRNWVFEQLFGPLKGNLTFLQMGDIVLIGTPCDFSGELFVEENLGKAAEKFGLQPVITSFNGDYTGYIIYDEHYEHSAKDEATVMNWVGPHYGAYYADMIKKGLDKLAHKH